MKAFLLAGGLGTRLRPLTLKNPKCLVEVCGKPMLYWWIKLLEKYNVKDVLINVHHHHRKVVSYLKNIDTKLNFEIFKEKTLLGSAGTIRANYDFVKNESDFFIFYADNLTNYNLDKLYTAHKLSNKIFTMALFETNIPREKGIVEIDKNNNILSFVEKPKNPKSNLANAGLYVAKPDIYKYFPK